MRWSAVGLLSACGFQASDGVAIDAQIDATAVDAIDAAVNPMVDAPPDAMIDAPHVFDPATDCPAYPITLAGQTSRYRILLTAERFAVHAADCANDVTGYSHLAALDNAAELSAVMTRVNATTGIPGGQGCVYVGGVQLRNQTTATVGWLSITGGPLLAIWDPNEPNDNDNNEDSSENVTMLERARTSLIDVGGTGLFGAVCECDGKPIDAAAAAAIIASAP